MSQLDKLAYQSELKRVAKNLGLSTRGNIEAAIIEHCRNVLATWIAAHGQPKTLSELLDLFVPSLNMGFEEIHSDADVHRLLKSIPPSEEPAMARIPSELDDETDAITIQRTRCQPWDRPFLAIVNCRGWHARRAFFTKWHEAVHRMLEGQQLCMAFRKTKALRREPQEVLVDKVAAELAFYPDIFKPVFCDELEKAGRLSFDVVDGIRQEVAPDASLQAMILACLRHCNHPIWFIRCAMALKKDEERRLDSPQMQLLPDEVEESMPKLRVQDVSGSPATNELRIRIHHNMRVPDSSIIAHAFDDQWTSTHTGIESFERWQTSSGGPIGSGEIEIEARRIDGEVWALISLRSSNNE